MIREETKIVELLQGVWESDDKKVGFTIVDKDIKNISGINTTASFLTLKWSELLQKWQISVPHFFWTFAFITEISDNSFTVYNYEPNEGETIKTDQDTNELLFPDRIYKFNRCNVAN